MIPELSTFVRQQDDITEALPKVEVLHTELGVFDLHFTIHLWDRIWIVLERRGVRILQQFRFTSDFTHLDEYTHIPS